MSLPLFPQQPYRISDLPSDILEGIGFFERFMAEGFNNFEDVPGAAVKRYHQLVVEVSLLGTINDLSDRKARFLELFYLIDALWRANNQYYDVVYKCICLINDAAEISGIPLDQLGLADEA